MLVGRTLVLWGPAEPTSANDDDRFDGPVTALRNSSDIDSRHDGKANVNIQYLRVVGE
jgi:hypothetical protein